MFPLGSGGDRSPAALSVAARADEMVPPWNKES